MDQIHSEGYLTSLWGIIFQALKSVELDITCYINKGNWLLKLIQRVPLGQNG